ncbi:MAG: hypothetical protein LC802_10635, partial [Acidobacteria bacterium]|nr:hypothetical protein [Acidobacteriota bacterium]
MATETRGLFARIIDGLIAIAESFFNLIRNIFGSNDPRPATIVRSRFKQDALRTEDLLVLQFEFINMDLKREEDAEGSRHAHLVPSADAFIVVRFPPQNIAEQAFFQADANYPVKPPEKFVKDPPITDKDENTETEEPTPPPVQSLLAHPSRLVFKIPQATPPVPYDLESLLELCARSPLSVTGTALPPPTDRGAVTRFNAGIMRDTFMLRLEKPPNITGQVSLSSAEKLISDSRARMREQISTPGRIGLESQIRIENLETIMPTLLPPTGLETAIELPFRLIISPSRYGAFAHAPHLVQSPLTKRVELWHTRLASVVGGKVNELNEWYRTIRAVWTRDNSFDPNKTSNFPAPEDEPFRTSLDSLDRRNIVHLTSNHHIWIEPAGGRRRRYVPLPVNVRRMMLSSLGGWLDLRGAWLPPRGSGLGVEEWRHIATMGRDHYVRVVYQGYLFPFMHRASLVKITERKFHTDKSGNPAYMRQRMFIIVREPEKLYPSTGLKTPDDRSYDLQWPISRIRLTTLVTPNLNP